jgi:hypothetical protein
MSGGKIWTLFFLVMVKNRGHITLVRIFVLVTFLLTVVLALKSEAKGNFYVHSETLPDNYYSHSLFSETTQTPSLLYFIPVKKRNNSCLFHPECAGYAELSRQPFSYLTPSLLSNYSLTFKIRGFNPINGPPAEAHSPEITENHKLYPKAIRPVSAGSCIRISHNFLPGVNESPLLLASLNGNESVVYATSNSRKNHPVSASGAAPQLECPEDISTYTDINTCSSFITGGLNPDFDETEVVTLTWEMEGAMEDASPRGGINLINDYTFDEGTTIITYTATGTDGTTATCTFTVTISDNQVPRLESIPADITVNAAPGACSATVFWIEPTATDNCTAPHLLIKEATNYPGDEFPAGTTTVYYTAYDAMGNPSQPESFTITVKDTGPPVLSLPADVTIACNDPLPASWQNLQQLLDAGGFAADNCTLNPASFRLISETPSSTICPYTLTRIYRIADAAGNVTTAEHRIILEGEGETVQPEQEEEVTLKSGMAEIISTSTGGNWNDPNTWVGNVVPGVGDNVTIATGATVTVNTDAFCDNILIESGGILNHGGAYTLQVNGNWTNNGTYNGGTNGIIEFAGTGNATISGTTTFEELVISKGSMSTLLNITDDITVSSGGSLVMNGGLVTIGSGNSLSLEFSNGVTIEETAGFDVTGGTLTTGNFTITNEGLIRVSAGTANLGTSSGNSVNNQFDAAFIVSGGNVNIAGRLHNSASGTLNPPNVSSGIHITGGTVTLSTAGQSLSNVGSLNVTAAGTFEFTGGTIVFQNPSTASTELDLGLISGGGTKNTDGGTFQFGNASTPANATFNISSQIPLHTVTTANNADLVLDNDLVISGQLTLNGSSELILNDHTIQIPVSTGNNSLSLPLADGSGNSIPVTLNLNGVTASGHITVSSFASVGTIPGGLSTTRFLDRHWVISGSGFSFSDYSLNLSYLAGDLAGGATTGNLKIYHHTDDDPSITSYPSFSSGINSFTLSGLTSFGEFGAAECDVITIAGVLSHLTCFEAGDGAINITVTGGAGNLIFDWSGPNGFISNAEDISGLEAGNYVITVTDGAGCTGTNSFEVTQPNVLSASAAQNNPVVCNGEANGEATATVSGGTTPYSYSWDKSISTSATANDLEAGLHTITITDANGCQTTAQVTIDEPDALTANAVQDNPVICNGESNGEATVTVSGGTTPYSYSWDKSTSTSATANDLEAGLHTISITDANGCQTTAQVTIDEPTPISFGTPTITDVTCAGVNDGQIIISASGGTGTINYTISPNEGSQSPSGTFSGLSAQTYTITATDNNNCTATIDVTVGTINDVTTPVISGCPADITFYTQDSNPANCSQPVSWTEPTASDNCALASFTRDYSPGDAFPVGTTTVTYTATDAAGNAATCAFEVTVVDNTPPNFTAPDPLTVNANANCDPPNLDPNVTLSKPYNLSDNCTATGSLDCNLYRWQPQFPPEFVKVIIPLPVPGP